MLGKRLVDYSEDEEANEIQPDDGASRAQEPERLSQVGQPKPESKPKKQIVYSKLMSNNAIKSLLSATGGVGKASDLKAEIEDAKKTTRTIEFETVSGRRQFELDAPREKVWKGSKKEREAYYYTAMKDIYKDKLAGIERPEEVAVPQGDQYTTEEVNGKQQQVRSISQTELVSFDYQRYLEQKERKELLLEDKLKMLQRNSLDPTHSRLTTRAYELLEKEATQQAYGTDRDEGFKRNKKQYGF